MRAWFILLLLGCVCLASAQYSVQQVNNVVYTTASGVPETMDLFFPLPVSGPNRKCVVFVHGGGWTAGQKEDFDGYGQYYASKGFVCCSINYRLTPQYVWPAQIDDTQAAVRYMRKNATAFALNPNDVAACGASAGGHLVLLLGTIDTLNDFDPALTGVSSKVQAVVDYYGPSDFHNQAEWDPSIWSLIVALTVPKPGWAFPSEKSIYKASPLNYVTPDDAKTLVFQGDADPIVPVDQSRRIVAKMQAKGVNVTYFEYPGEGHGFSNATNQDTILKINQFFGLPKGF